MSMPKTSVHKEDYRTNRADYLIAKAPIPKAEPKPKKRSSRLGEQRRLSEGPLETVARPQPRR
ncbi:hypothetical protein [Mesorhizobium sp. M4B.F.Ca.ET.017.02.2.1]|uniref:hypothetical protein n=1 Tax=Mesorhizobium sp. M4B.F.Ca.ET.017.02.2.1 TaxID=2496649 RepID=UPI000FCB850F|nr:hypothetical protein [Mesorhizobium sp. M4B.F.Ca.ET.017.02.2.1]RVD27086.1 hypothetical protein EN738_12385 [Mesorhizobium sp. M4B.F.Ca.ET.017.02.2.1]